jgi:hypothetical protein
MATGNWVQVTGGEGRLLGKVRAAVDATRLAREELTELYAILGEASVDEAQGRDYGVLCAAFGWADNVETRAAAAAVFSNIQNAAGAIAGADFTYMLNRLG